MGIFLKHLWLIPHILKWQNGKIFTNLVLSLNPSRRSHRKCSVKKKIFLKIYKISRENTCVGVCLNFIKKRLQHRYFPVKFTNFLRTPILENICERLLLTIVARNSLETRVVLIEIFMLCWNLPSGLKHRGWLQKKQCIPWRE